MALSSESKNDLKFTAGMGAAVIIGLALFTKYEMNLVEARRAEHRSMNNAVPTRAQLFEIADSARAVIKRDTSLTRLFGKEHPVWVEPRAGQIRLDLIKPMPEKANSDLARFEARLNTIFPKFGGKLVVTLAKPGELSGTIGMGSMRGKEIWEHK